MDIFNRPPAIAEDTLQYTICPGPAFPDKSAVTALATLIDARVSSLLPGHIWHRDAFELKVVDSSHGEIYIEGRMRVGDCVDDEWCVVWLLKDITCCWDVAVSVFDSDGDFLLIEAAEHLPAWITPTNSENRVWIYQDRLHIVPLQYVSPVRQGRRMPVGAGSDDEGDTEADAEYISVLDAHRIVRDPKSSTLATSDVEQAAFQKIMGYPRLALQHLHRTQAYIPSDIALALSSNPPLVQKAIEAFYTRDALQLRVATRMTRFPPNTSVLSTVTMTRTAYAQLMGQKFHAPKVFGQWNEKEGSPEWRWRDIGMKIACGFEMVYQETKGRHGNPADGVSGPIASSVEARKEALRRDPEYVKYIRGLQRAGFFKDEIEGSALWNVQESRAASQFIITRQIDNASRPSFALQVNFAISQSQTQRDKGGAFDFIRGEDSDDWLSLDEGMLNDMLSTRYQMSSTPEGDMDMDKGDHTGVPEDKQAAEQADQLRSLANKVEKFVEGKGDVEGAMFEDDLLSDEADMSDLSDSDDEDASESELTSDVKMPTTAERQAAMDKLVPALEPSEYGTMPASFHRNSQKVKEVALESQPAAAEESLKPDESPELRPVRPLVFPRDRFDGVEDSDDESEEEGGGDVDDGDDEDQPQIVGELEVDMQEEEEEFLRFSREALGISREMWDQIVRERKGRGAFLPHSVLREDAQRESRVPPPQVSSNSSAGSGPQRSDSGARPNGNPNLDTFEAVMQAMDAELSRAKRSKHPASEKITAITSATSGTSPGKGKQREEGDDESIIAAMDAEVHAALRDSSDDEEDQEDEATIDYTLMKNFLESFKSQQGLPGPVGNLVGRLGWQLPRDTS